ncbi:unnamed protein product [Clonostachys rosea f. rosea IK726]|uniref:Uncharacterized protein n=1 Tax=Clonostachys rosea f. rosea IK726 TaxID=1349383 RepID=A0ACA9TFM6_BIOOC|nr:unnamed protein product [Clonostachys rosea f. rosea IK726]
MSIITVLGATGSQGGSVVTTLYGNPSWKVRAVTRNPESDAAKKLIAMGVEVVAGDADDEASLIKAFGGTTAIFALTNFDWNIVMQRGQCVAGQIEKQQQMNIANAASKIPTLKHYIMSSLPPAKISSHGRLPVPHFDFKHEAYQHIQGNLPSLAAKMTRIWVGWYPSNMAFSPLMKLIPVNQSGAYIWIQPSKEDAILPIAGDVQHNVGVVVEGILEAGAKAFNKVAIVITDYIKISDAVRVWESVSGSRAVYVGVPDSTIETIWGVGGLEIAAQLRWSEEFPDWHRVEPGHVISLEELGVVSRLRGFKQALESVKASLT